MVAPMIMTMSCLGGILLTSFPYLNGPHDLGGFCGGKHILTPLVIPSHPANQAKRFQVDFRRINGG
jgi:hypothetical protein